MDTLQKHLGFTKGGENYTISYTDVRDLIHCLVDYADDPRYNLDLMDVFILVHRIACMHTRSGQSKKPSAER